MAEFSARLLRAYHASPYASQNELARAAGLAVPHLSRLLSGRYERPQLKTARRLAKALGVPVTALYPQPGG